MRALLPLCALLLAGNANPPVGSPLIDFEGHARLVQTVGPVREQRLLSLSEFRKRASASGALLLDARSAQAFKEGHMKGAINLPLPDFTAESLSKLVGADSNRPIFIYCNNNFTDNRRPVMTKALPLALNIQTFVNLYGYGYHNVWELGEAVATTDQAVRWTGTRSRPKRISRSEGR